MTIDTTDLSSKLTIYVDDKSYYTNSNLSLLAEPSQVYDFANAVNDMQADPLGKIVRTMETLLVKMG